MAHSLGCCVSILVDRLDLVFAESWDYDCCWNDVIDREQVLSR